MPETRDLRPRSPDWPQLVRRALSSPGRLPDDDVVEELAQHAAARFQAARAEGESAAEAEQRVTAELLESWQAQAPSLHHASRRPAAVVAPAASGSILESWAQDLRYSLHLLSRARAHTAVTVATMALGVGVTTLLASLVHGVLMKPLPWADAERVVRFAETREGATRSWPWLFTNATYRSWQEKHETLEVLAGFDGDGEVQTLSGGREPERIRVLPVTASLFELLRAKPEIGSTLNPADEVAGDALLLSHGLWRDSFGSDPKVVGRVVRMDGQARRIVGVMPRSFAFPDAEARAWTVLEVPPLTGPEPGSMNLALFAALGRLRTGASPEQAAAEGTARGGAAPDAGLVTRALFGGGGAVKVSATPVLDAVTGEVRPALWLLFAAGALLLATATANVASLQLARATARRRELAVRGALGAGAGRIARQLLVESLVLAVAGGSLGLLLALAGHRLLPSLLPADFPRAAELSLDWPSAGFALLVSLSAGVVFALLPALMVRRQDLARALADESSGSVGPGRSGVARARSLILGGQVAVASVLLLGAIQLGRSWQGLLSVDLGYEPSNLLTVSLPLPESSYTPVRRAQLLSTLLERVGSLPGVRQAAFSNIAPLSASEAMVAFVMPPSRIGSEPVQANTSIRIVSPSYFEALGRKLIRGRAFDSRDGVGAAPAVIVNRTFATRYLGAEPLGRVVPAGVERRKDWIVIGVVEDALQRGPLDRLQPEIFVSHTQLKQGLHPPVLSLLVRTTGDPLALAPTVRALIREQDPDLIPDQMTTLRERLTQTLSRPRLYATLVGLFAIAALVIAAVGLFGVLSYLVTLRTREVAVRMALGARPWDVVALVASQGLRLALSGVTAGLLLAIAGGSLLAGLLHGVTPVDAEVALAVPAAVVAVAALACAWPAWRAARVDPQQALRST